MQHKGNKNDITIAVEKVFIGICRAVGMEIFYEYACGTGTVDFVVGISADKDERSMYYAGQTGVELKTSMNDLRTWNGLNIRAFPYNYILVPENIAYSAMRHMERYNKEFKHVGLIVLMDDYSLVVQRYATPIMPKELTPMNKRCEEDKYASYPDSVALLVAFQDEKTVVSVHNFNTGKTHSEKVEITCKRTKIKDALEAESA